MFELTCNPGHAGDKGTSFNLCLIAPALLSCTPYAKAA